MLGIPDKYAMERGGWSTDSVLKNVYQQTFQDESNMVSEKIDNFFMGLLLSHEDTHEEEASLLNWFFQICSIPFTRSKCKTTVTQAFCRRGGGFSYDCDYFAFFRQEHEERSSLRETRFGKREKVFGVFVWFFALKGQQYDNIMPVPLCKSSCGLWCTMK